MIAQAVAQFTQFLNILKSKVERRTRKLRHSNNISLGLNSGYVRIRNVTSGGPKLIRLLLVSDGGSPTSEQQFAPLFRHAGLLSKELGVVFQHRHIDAVLKFNRQLLSKFDVVGFMLSFRTPAQEAERIAKHFREMLIGTPTKLAYFDGDDDANIQWPIILDIVDLYVKNQVFADEREYLSTHVGKSNLTDYVSRTYNISFAENIIPKSGALDLKHLGKIYLGWNLALGDDIFELLQRVKSVPAVVRDIDIACRASVPKNAWISPFRSTAIERIKALSNRFRVIASQERVSKDKYYEEMFRSRACVSPFGFGEVCWRDFEAILCGCLLIKPNMSHLRTLPDIFIPENTFVSTQWDYSDLENRSAPYLLDESERERIVRNARDVLICSLQPDWFLARFREFLTRVSVHSP